MWTINFSMGTTDHTEKFVLWWKIPKFTLDDETKTEIYSIQALDQTPNVQNPRFQMKLQLCDGSGYYKALFSSPNTVFVKSLSFKVYYEAKDPNVYSENTYRRVQQNEWYFLTFIWKQPRGCSLTVELQYEINKDISNDITKDIAKKIKVDRGIDVSESQLNDDLKNLLDSGLFSDVTMVSVEQSEYKVHRAILGSRSDVLKAYFAHNTTECINNIVESQFESEVLKEVLTFIYSDNAPRVDEIPEKLLVAADYYQLNKLKGLCEKALHKKLTTENAIEILQLADLYSATTLTTLTLDFIKDKAKLVTKTKGWANLKSAELIKKIHEHVTE